METEAKPLGSLVLNLTSLAASITEDKASNKNESVDNMLLDCCLERYYLDII